MKSKRTIYYLALCLTLSSFASLVNGQDEELIYSERFVNLSGANLNFSEAGYTALAYYPSLEEKLFDVTTLDAEAQGALRLTGIGGRGYEICFCEDDTGGPFFWTFGTEGWYLISYPLTIDRSEKEISRVSWFMSWGGTVFPMGARFVVKIGGQYYASSTVYTELDQFEKNDWQNVEYVFTESMDWQLLTVDINQPFNLDGTIVDLPSGDIEEIGFYVYKGDGADQALLRFDEVEIFATAAAVDSTWAGYDVDAEGYADTMGWLGWVNVSAAPWVYSYNLGGWMHVNEANVSASGSWTYIPK